MARILFFQWDAFMQKGMENALQCLKGKLSIEYDMFYYRMGDWDTDEVLAAKLERACARKYDAVLMVNFCPVVSDVCEKLNILYIAYVYDCPLHIRRTESLFHECNRIYFFDRAQCYAYTSKGVKHAGHALLAADTDLYDRVQLTNQDQERYGCDVSLVGKLYQSDFAYLCRPLTQYQRGYLEGLLGAQSHLYGGYVLDELLDEPLLEELNREYLRASGGKSTVCKEELSYAMNCEITGRERYTALAVLSQRFRVRVFSGDTNQSLDKVLFGGYLDYYNQMPKAFKASKINLNITLKAIQTGIPLRVFDVLGCGGFLLTNYQEEIAEQFRNGTDLVMYSSMEELVEKVGYYLAHEEERLWIARNGYERVKEVFSFDAALETILTETLLCHGGCER